MYARASPHLLLLCVTIGAARSRQLGGTRPSCSERMPSKLVTCLQNSTEERTAHVHRSNVQSDKAQDLPERERNQIMEARNSSVNPGQQQQPRDRTWNVPAKDPRKDTEVSRNDHEWQKDTIGPGFLGVSGKFDKGKWTKEHVAVGKAWTPVPTRTGSKWQGFALTQKERYRLENVSTGCTVVWSYNCKFLTYGRLIDISERASKGGKLRCFVGLQGTCRGARGFDSNVTGSCTQWHDVWEAKGKRVDNERCYTGVAFLAPRGMRDFCRQMWTSTGDLQGRGLIVWFSMNQGRRNLVFPTKEKSKQWKRAFWDSVGPS